MKSRGAFGLVELAVALAVGALLFALAFDMLTASRRTEDRIGRRADQAKEAARARTWLARDLDRLAGDLTVEGPVALALEVERDGARVRWSFADGALTRREDGARDEVFRLGADAYVCFVKVDPSFAGGGVAELGRYNNRLAYRITAGLTLIGSAPFLVKASRDTFPFWNPEPRIDQRMSK